jgi:hypothetical protein
MITHKTRSHHAKAMGVNTWSSSVRLGRWRRQLAGEMTGSHQQSLNRANGNWHDYFIMAWDGFIVRPTEFMGNRSSKPLMQMGRACSSPEAAWNRQGDDGFSPWLGGMKGLSTTLQVESEFYLIDMNFALIVPWGEFSQRLWAVSLLWRISHEFKLSPVFSVFSLNHLARNFALFVSWNELTQSLREVSLLW